MGLTVIYDADCGFCWKVRRILQEDPGFIPLTFLAYGGPEATQRFPGLCAGPKPELIVVDHDQLGLGARAQPREALRRLGAAVGEEGQGDESRILLQDPAHLPAEAAVGVVDDGQAHGGLSAGTGRAAPARARGAAARGCACG